MKDKLHIIIVLSLVFLAAIIFIIISALLRPKSFDEYGHYRWNAVNDILTQQVIIQSTKTCSECHSDIYNLHEKDAHYNVPCVDCHGAGNQHTEFHRKNITSKVTADQARMPKEYNLEGCLFCHRKLKAKPSDFPQINHISHYEFLHIKDSTTKCIACHNPHEPIFLLTEARKARLHPIVYKCTDCHNTKPTKDFKTVADHPTIFECRDCHAQVVKSFEERPHNNYVECRTCHLFHRENESVGRMYKNGNAKFCLLCHENKPFKDEKYPPKVEWPGHIGNLKYIENLNQKICLNCHWNKIHEMNIKNSDNPHPANWQTGHRPFLMNKFQNKFAAAKCGECHQTNFCISCHKMQIPHSAEFKEGEHKEVSVEKGLKSCLNCHKKEFCTNCHDMPKLSYFQY